MNFGSFEPTTNKIQARKYMIELKKQLISTNPITNEVVPTLVCVTVEVYVLFVTGGSWKSIFLALEDGEFGLTVCLL